MANFEKMQASREPSRTRRFFRWFRRHLWWALGALAAAPLAAFAVHTVPQSSEVISLSTGLPAAMMLAALIGLRSRGLQGVFMGLLIGALVGYADLKLFEVVYAHTGASIGAASMIPFWGILLGLWCGFCRGAKWQFLWAAIIGGAADLAGRALWSTIGYAMLRNVGEALWLFESFAYALPAVLLLVMTRPGPRKTGTEPDTGCAQHGSEGIAGTGF